MAEYNPTAASPLAGGSSGSAASARDMAARQATLQHAKLQAMAMARTKWLHQEEMGANPNEIQFFYHKAPKGEASEITNTDQCLWTSMLSIWLNVAGFLALATSSSRHFQTSWVLGKNITHLLGSCNVSCLLLMLA